MQIPKLFRKKRVTNRVARTVFDRAKRDQLQPVAQAVITHRREHRATSDVGMIPKGTWLVDEAVTPRQARRRRYPDQVGTMTTTSGVFEHDWRRTSARRPGVGEWRRSAERPEGEGWQKMASGAWRHDPQTGEAITVSRVESLVTTYRETDTTDAQTSWGGQLVRLSQGEQPPTAPGARRALRGSARQRRRDRRVLAAFPELATDGAR